MNRNSGNAVWERGQYRMAQPRAPDPGSGRRVRLTGRAGRSPSPIHADGLLSRGMERPSLARALPLLCDGRAAPVRVCQIRRAQSGARATVREAAGVSVVQRCGASGRARRCLGDRRSAAGVNPRLGGVHRRRGRRQVERTAAPPRQYRPASESRRVHIGVPGETTTGNGEQICSRI